MRNVHCCFVCSRKKKTERGGEEWREKGKKGRKEEKGKKEERKRERESEEEGGREKGRKEELQANEIPSKGNRFLENHKRVCYEHVKKNEKGLNMLT